MRTVNQDGAVAPVCLVGVAASPCGPWTMPVTLEVRVDLVWVFVPYPFGLAGVFDAGQFAGTKTCYKGTILGIIAAD